MFRIEVENIKCLGCANSIREALMRINKVDTVDVNIEKGFVIITGDANRDSIITRLTQLGYPEKGNNSLSCKAKSYMSCALGKL